MASFFSTTNMTISASTLFSASASLAAFMMMVRSVVNEVILDEFRSYISNLFYHFFSIPLSTTLTLIIDEFSGMTRNEVYDAATIYLQTKISPSVARLKISKTPREKQISVAIEKGESITDEFEGMKLKWRYVCEGHENNYSSETKVTKQFELSFKKKFKDKVMNSYLPYVLERASEIKVEQKVVKLYNRDCPFDDEDGGGGTWGSVNLKHPSTFETIAMDPESKKIIVEDLERFLRRREFYKRVGKAWERGYLLYGPPGTGKSSLIAAMANYLKFDIYDLELTSIQDNSDFRRTLLSTTNRSILVIEDIDCSVQMHNREETNDHYVDSDSKLTLSGVLNFIDGLWSSCGDERIIIFTTNHKDKLDPALLRPGRMDVHINMSYCTTPGFHILASNYLGIDSKTHRLSMDIESLIKTTNVTPAEIAEELMKSEDTDVVLERKNSEANEVKTEEKCKVEEYEDNEHNCDDDEKNIGCNEKNIRCNGRKKSSKAAKKGKKKKKFM